MTRISIASFGEDVRSTTCTRRSPHFKKALVLLEAGNASSALADICALFEPHECRNYFKAAGYAP